MENIKPVRTQVGIISGRDALYLDEIKFDYKKNIITFIGEINGELCSASKIKGFIHYKMNFKDVLYFKMIELDVSLFESQSSFGMESCIVELLETDMLMNIEKARGVNSRHFVVSTYDDVFNIVCKELEIVIYDSSSIGQNFI